MPFDALVLQYGFTAAMAVWFAIEKVWPAIAGLFPMFASRRQQEREAQLQAEREEREAQRRVIERLFTVIEQNTAAFIELRAALNVVAQQSNATAQALADLHRDVVAGLPPQTTPAAGTRTPRSSRKEPAAP